MNKGSNYNVLVIDDEEHIRETFTDFLNAYGYNVDAVSEGREGIEFYKSAFKKDNKYDVVIIDHNLPGLRGYEVLDEILRIDPKAKAVLCTGAGISDLGKFKAGFVKFRLENLIPKLEKIIQQSD